MKGLCKHCLMPIATESAGGPWQAFGNKYPTLCDANDGKLHEEILQGLPGVVGTVETGNIRISLFPSRGRDAWYPCDAEREEILGVDGVAACDIVSCGGCFVVDADNLEYLPEVVQLACRNVFAIIRKYDEAGRE